MLGKRWQTELASHNGDALFFDFRNMKEKNKDPEEKEDEAATITTPTAFNGNKSGFCMQLYHKDYYS